MHIEQTLTDHIIALREKVARMESDVRHLSHEQGAHTGSLRRTDTQLAHIAQSCRDAHLLIQRIQIDVTALGKRSRLADVLKEWAPVLTPALIGSIVLLLTLLGKSDLAAKLATVK